MSLVGRVKSFVGKVGTIGAGGIKAEQAESEKAYKNVIDNAVRRLRRDRSRMKNFKKEFGDDPGGLEPIERLTSYDKQHLKDMVRLRRQDRESYRNRYYKRGRNIIGGTAAATTLGGGLAYHQYKKNKQASFGPLVGGVVAVKQEQKRRKSREKKEKRAATNWKALGLTGGGMAGGALAGTMIGAHEARKRDPNRATSKEIDTKYKMIAARVKAHQDPTYINKTRAARAQMAYEVERAGREHPKGHVARRATQGAVAGGLTAPALAYGGKRLYQIIKGGAS